MEVVDDAVLDRIRVIEDKIENGNFSVTVSQSGSVSQTQSQNYEKAALPQALPEDVQKVVSNWRQIKNCFEGMIKIGMDNATVSLSNENKLLIVTPQNTVKCEYLFKEGVKEEIENVISQQIGSQISIELQRMTGDAPINSVYPDILTMAGINTTIVEEE